MNTEHQSEEQIDVFGNKCLRSILGYRWNDSLSNQRMLHETESRPITSIVRQLQLQLYGHVACYPEAVPASKVVSERDNPGWRRPREYPQSLWLGQVDASCSELLCMWRGFTVYNETYMGWSPGMPLIYRTFFFIVF